MDGGEGAEKSMIFGKGRRREREREDRSAGCEGEGEWEDIWRSGEVKNPRTEVKRTVSDTFAHCRSIGLSLAIDRLSSVLYRDRSQ